ncbi:hypothetical protein GCM10023187_42510 [Nibrella viscosa]|uniref:Uncharacterized protein n=1 Tax=Nibrella viscosa TaxID=1084524 RepID=A0ABP8KRS2_9BACT
MATVSHASTVYTGPHSQKANWPAQYADYVAKAEFNRIGWAASALAVQGCILSPALLLTMAYFGGGDWQFLVSMLGFLVVLVPVLAALPVRFIFRMFTLSALAHLIIILINVLQGLAG